MLNSVNKNDIRRNNPWWIKTSFNIEERKWIHRDLYFKLKEDFDSPMILNILGMRRVGKSTITKQLIADLLKKEKHRKRIFYYLFDEITINTTQNFETILNYYLDEILETKIFNLKNRIYIFLDEIQYIPNWQAVLKKYYDLSNKKIKFIITGSQSILLRKKSVESLAGRVFDYYLQPLSFTEFLKIKKSVCVKDVDNIRIDIHKIDKYFSKLEEFNYSYNKEISKLSKEYILTGQFPECLDIKTEDNKNIYLRESVLGKITEDILAIYDIDKIEHFKILASYLFANSGNLLELKNISRQIGLSFISLDKYFSYLKSAYLFKVLFKYHKSSIKQGRLLKKNYSTSSNFVSTVENYTNKHFQEVPEIFGLIIETAIFNFLDQYYTKNSLINNISFWRQGEKEIDFIISLKNKKLPIEVKFTKSINYKDLRTLVNYVSKNSISFGIVVTKSKLSKEIIDNQRIFFIPYYLFLLMSRGNQDSINC